MTDDSLVQCLVEIRRALGDDQAWIHTARGRGYRFDGDVRPLVRQRGTAGGSRSRRPHAPTGVTAAPSRGRAWLLAVAVVAMLAVAAAASGVLGQGAGVLHRGPPRRDSPTRKASGASSAAPASHSARRSRPTSAPSPSIRPSPPGTRGWPTPWSIRGVFGGARPDDSYPRARVRRRRGPSSSTRRWPRGMSRSGTSRSNGIATGAGAERSYRRALALDPSAPRAHMLYALFLGAMGRVDESLQESRIARLAPARVGQPSGRSGRSCCSARGVPRRRSSRAGATDRLDPAFSLVHFWQALALADVGRFDEAMTEALASRTGVGNLPVAGRRLHPRPRRPPRRGPRGVAGARGGARPIHLRPGHRPRPRGRGHGRSRGGADVARARLRRARPLDVLDALFPPFDPLRDEPRFKALVAKMKFP